MSFVDYGQTAEDHQSLLVLVRHTGSHLPVGLFNRMWERIRTLNVVHVQGQNRNVTVRYKRVYPVENNQWGDFQAHRKVLGLVSVGKCADHEEFADLFENYKKVKEEYSSTIINSRLIIFGMNTDGSPIDASQKQPSSSPVPSQHSQLHSDGNPDSDHGISAVAGCGDSAKESASSGPDGDMNGAKGGNNSETTVMENMEKNIVGEETDLNPREGRTGSENCSVTITRVGGDASCAPQHSDVAAGKKELASGGKENDGAEKGRLHSNSLTKESTGSEVVFYPSLEQCSDLEERLKEFVTSLFFVLEGKRLERTFERSDRLMLLCAPFEKKDCIGVDTDTRSFKRKCMGRLRKHLGDLCLQASLPGEAILHYQTALDLLRTVNDFLWMGACYEGLCSASVVLTTSHSKPTPPLRRNLSFSVKRDLSSPEFKHMTTAGAPLRQQGSLGSFSNGLDHLDQPTTLHCLNPDDIIEKYKEAITHYSKFKHSAMVEMEASMKACRILICQRKYMQAAEFLQNVVYISLASSEEDKVHRYSTLSSLYGQIGFHRKEAFFRRVAAMQCVSSSSNFAWRQCYQLLLQAVEGYNIALDPRDSIAGPNNGWPVIQHRVLHELVYSARRMGNLQLAVRHSTLLLHTMYTHLRPEEQKEAVAGLETLTSKCQGTPRPLSTDVGMILPPVNLVVLSFKVLCPPPHLRPMKIMLGKDLSSSVFIYTPLSLGSSNRKSNSSNVGFEWVAEEMCEVQLQLVNPLAVELHLLYLGLLTEGLEVEMCPASLSITPLLPQSVKVMVKPRTPGQLRVLGYSTQVFGVRSNCRLRDVAGSLPDYYSVEVVPALPQLSMSCSLPKGSTFAPPTMSNAATVVTSAAALLYAGQSQDSVVTLDNIGSHPVTSVSITLEARSDNKECTDKMFLWSDANIQSQLPLPPGRQLCIALCLYAHSDFLLPHVTSPDATSSSLSSHSHSDSSDKGTQTVEAVLCVEYTGGPGQEAGYCRRCSLAITVDVVPSLYITNWDAQPAVSNQDVSLVLELINVSSHLLDFQCQHSALDPTLTIVLEPQQCQRVAMVIPRVCFPEEQAERFQSCIPIKYRTWRTPDFHSQLLSSFLDLQWTMPAAKVKGKVCIDYLKWTEDQLDHIRQPEISWEVLVNSQHYTAPDLMSFPSAQPVSVEVTVSAARHSYQDVTLTVQPFQESGQGEGQHALHPDSYLCLGSQTVSATELGPECQLHHCCSFLFLSAGRYLFHISCTAGPSSSSYRPVPQFSITP